jgi:hypothetical protein
MNMEQPVACLGSASLYLALLATAASCWTEAVEHFEASLREHERLGAAPLLARTRYEYARMLLRRGQAADRDRVHDLLDRAAATAQMLGMATLTAQTAELLDTSTAEGDPPPCDPLPTLSLAGGEQGGGLGPGVGNTQKQPSTADSTTPRRAERDRFQREGEFWTVSYDDSVVRLKDSKGLRQIALLLAQPGRELHATDLETLVSGPAEPAASGPGKRVGYGELEARPDFGDAGELLDAEARAAYKSRLDDLQEEIDEAEEFNDPVRAEKARDERQFLIRELARAVGLGGRDRKAASHAERARLNATRAIRAAMTNLAREHPALWQHLAATIRTGRYCSYTPDPRSPIDWQL